MDLKSTKVTELSITESKFRHSVLQSGIGKVSAALKSTSDNQSSLEDLFKNKPINIKYKHHHSGFAAEFNVQKLLETKGWKLIFHRFKTKVCEIDLVFEKENKILLVEVKKLTQTWRAFQRITPNQQLKLKANNLLFTLNFKDKKVESYVACVDQKNQISF